MTSGDKDADRTVEETASTDVEPVADDIETEETAEEDGAEESGSGGRGILVGFLLLVILGLGGYASLPYWRQAIPEPYRSYLPDLPPSENRRLIAGMEDTVKTNTAELDRLRAEVKALRGEIEEIGDAASPTGGSTVAEIGALKERFTALEARLRAIAAGAPAGASGAAGAPAGGDVLHRLDLIAGRVEQQAEAIKAMTAKADQKSTVQKDELAEISRRLDMVEATRAEAASVLRLSDRINDVEKLARAMASRHDASLANLLAVVQLRAKAADGQPFDAELRTARALADDKPAFDALAGGFTDLAGKGVATTAALRHSFDALSVTAAQAAAAPQGDSLLDKSIGRVTGLITVRRLDGKDESKTVPAILARAETFLNAGDLNGAVKELKGIEVASAAAVMKPWIARAEARVALDAALSTLTSDALARVAASAMQNAPAENRKKGS